MEKNSALSTDLLGLNEKLQIKFYSAALIYFYYNIIYYYIC